jgi:hypothetical protein
VVDAATNTLERLLCMDSFPKALRIGETWCWAAYGENKRIPQFVIILSAVMHVYIRTPVGCYDYGTGDKTMCSIARVTGVPSLPNVSPAWLLGGYTRIIGGV